jgi:hypothetical protein
VGLVVTGRPSMFDDETDAAVIGLNRFVFNLPVLAFELGEGVLLLLMLVSYSFE